MIERSERFGAGSKRGGLSGLLLTVALLSPAAIPASAGAADGPFTLEQALSYPFVDQMASAERADRVAWMRNINGVRNIWVAQGPDFTPRQITHYTGDDGQELTQLTFSPDGAKLLYVRGGDHDANWPAEGHLAPDPAAGAEEPVVTIWSASLSGGAPVKIAEGDAPALSAKGQLAYIKDNQVWTAPLDGGGGKPERLFFDRGHDTDLRWSPEGTRLAFVSRRGDHGLIGLYTGKDKPLSYLAPSTSQDSAPRWSPDGTRIAFVRNRGEGGAPEPLSVESPEPWSIWVADATTGAGRPAWVGPKTLEGSFPHVAGGANLHWGAGDRLVFLSEIDNWPHLYSVPAAGGAATLLTPGAFMVEHIAESRDRRFMVYDANTGTTKDDDDRRHLFRVSVDKADAKALTSGDDLQMVPVTASADAVAYIAAGAGAPPGVAIVALDGGPPKSLTTLPTAAEFPTDKFVTPKSVAFTAADGTAVHGQLFQQPGGPSRKPGIVFLHGGPPRQMLLGWSYMDYYSNAYAVNQYLAAHGFAVLSVNYRLGIGYGRAFQHPANAGFRGGAEYQDVVAGARFLQKVPGVDPAKIGLWGGSYGGYLTAMGLSRNSDIFKAGVDLHGVHDWSIQLGHELGQPAVRYEQGDRAKALELAWTSSPDSTVSGWKSPVLLIQGDDDRNVDFQQTVDLARRLEAQNTPFEEMVIPDEIHGFLRHEAWLKADKATADFFQRQFYSAAAAH
jgi:dipeptidyl aminopeptidase/acylaminoacyl peptidase